MASSTTSKVPKSSPQVPWDILEGVIDQVSQFREDVARCHSLSSLCLVSRAFSRTATTLLYATPPPLRCSCPGPPHSADGIELWKLKFLDTLVNYPYLTQKIQSFEVTVCYHNGIPGMYGNVFPANSIIKAMGSMTNLRRICLRSRSPWNTSAMNSFFAEMMFAVENSGARICSFEWSSLRSLVEFKRFIPWLEGHRDTLTSLAIHFVGRDVNLEDPTSRESERDHDRVFMKSYNPYHGQPFVPIFPLPELKLLSVSSWDTLDLLLPMVVFPGQLTQVSVKLPITSACIPQPIVHSPHYTPGTTLSPTSSDENSNAQRWKKANFSTITECLAQHAIKTLCLEFSEDGTVPGWGVEDMAEYLGSVEGLTLVNPTFKGLELTVAHLPQLHTLNVCVRRDEAPTDPLELLSKVERIFARSSSLKYAIFKAPTAHYFFKDPKSNRFIFHH